MSPKELRQPKLKPMTLAQYEERKRGLEQIAAVFRGPDGGKWVDKSKPGPRPWRFCITSTTECSVKVPPIVGHEAAID